MAIKAEIKNGKLHLVVDMQDPVLSKSEKSLIVATSHGNQPCGVNVDGSPVILGLNAYIKP